MGLFTLHNCCVSRSLNFLKIKLDSQSRPTIPEYSSYHCMNVFKVNERDLNINQPLEDKNTNREEFQLLNNKDNSDTTLNLNGIKSYSLILKEELSFWNKLKFSNLYIFTTWRSKPLIFQT